ncbi:MAG TPA: hypothetical protein VFC09_05750 [Candidatus Dormibacteraeota bacterium]|nr:hypothetical protein [Candidatus Dormibacteraeota bacterium]
MNRFKRLALVAAGVATCLAMAVPASAQGAIAGAGAVQGNVNLNPGFATGCLPLCNQAWTFAGSATGAFVGAGTPSSALAGAAEGTFTAAASGSSIAENAAGGAGNLTASGSGGLTCIGACWDSSGNHCIGICNLSMSITCTAGVYVRVGVYVYIILQCTVTINGYSYTVVIYVGGLFIPNQTPPSTLTSATFAGAFKAAGALP